MAIQRTIIYISSVLCSLFIFSGCGEMVHKEKEIGFKGVAKYDHFLAASRFMREMGIESGSYTQLPEFPPPPNTTIFLPASSVQSEGMLQELDDWVYYDGGKLICYLENGTQSDFFKYAPDEGRLFLDYMGISVEEVQQQDNTGTESTEEEEETDAAEMVTSMNFDESAKMKATYKTSFSNNFYLYFEEDGFESAEEDGFISLDFDHGEGLIEVWTTSAPFTNKSLQEEEHAALLWDLVKGSETERVWFVHSSQISFWKLLWEKGRYALIPLMLLLIFWIWTSIQRFGPLFQTENSTENTLEEHLTASGYFFSQHKADTLILDELKQSMYLKLCRKVNLPINTPASELLDNCKRQGVLTPMQLSLFTEPYPEKNKERLPYLKKIQSLNQDL